MPKKQNPDKVIDQINKELEEKEYNMKHNQKIETIKTWTIVLLIGAIFVSASFFLGREVGIDYQKSQDDTIKREAISLSEQMATSKPQQ